MSKCRPGREQGPPNDLADRTEFILDDEHWDEFVELLNRPSRPMAELAAFLAAPSVVDTAADETRKPQVSDD